MNLCRTAFAVALPLVLFASNTFAASHTVTVFQCVNKNDRKVNVSLINGQYHYEFGKINAVPDITLVRNPDQLTHSYHKTMAADTDTGTAQLIELHFKNGTYTYTVYEHYLGSKHKAGVEVYNKGKLVTNVSCLPNTLINKLSEHIWDIPEDNG